MEARHDSSSRNTDDFGDLFIRKALDIGEIDRDSKFFGNLCEGSLNIRIWKVLEYDIFSRLTLVARVGRSFSQLPIFDF